MLSNAFEQNISRKTNLTIEQIRNTPLDELRAFLKANNTNSLRVVSEYPAIGRGNVLRDGIVSGSELNSEIDRMLGL